MNHSIIGNEGNLVQDIIMWSEELPSEQVKLSNAIKAAIHPVCDAPDYLAWQGEELVLKKDCPGKIYTAIYFWLSGWGDRQSKGKNIYVITYDVTKEDINGYEVYLLEEENYSRVKALAEAAQDANKKLTQVRQIAAKTPTMQTIFNVSFHFRRKGKVS